MKRPALHLPLRVSLWIAALGPLGLAGAGDNVDWGVQRGDAGGTQYSGLAQIHAANVHRLQPAWEYHTGDAAPGSTMQVNPLVVDGVMYLTTPGLKAVALDAATGRERWVFDPAGPGGKPTRLRNRGVTYWKAPDGTARIFHFVRDRVYALDARTGALISTFGEHGSIDLRQHLGIDPEKVVLEMTSPGAICRDLLIVGSRVTESFDASPGHLRAYDAWTGEFRWIFHTIPEPGEPGAETWRRVEGETYGGANAWSGLTVDAQRGWVFAATGSPTEDWYGARRAGQNLYGDCVLALDAATGALQWHYQTVHHDLWDYDNPAPPVLATLRTPQGPREIVAQVTKTGYVFVLDRATGEPVFPVQEIPVPRSDVPGEEAWPTQPVPTKPRALVRQGLTEADLTNITPEAHDFALREFRRYRAGAPFAPPSLQGTLTTPGIYGGAEWNGASFNPLLNVLYVNVNNATSINQVSPLYQADAAKPADPAVLGRHIYAQSCQNCHGREREGAPPLVPALHSLRTTREERATLIRSGRNSMPAFSQLRPAELDALLAYLETAPGAVPPDPAAGAPVRYAASGLRLFLDPHGVPASAPPWGTLNAIDLIHGEILWQVPLGEYPQLAAQGIRHTGTLNFGGAVSTAGGVIFVAATADEKIRAFDVHAGTELWEQALPAGGYATPSVYQAGGTEYVAIAAGGGGKNATRSGDTIVAFALPPEATSPPTPPDASWRDLFDGRTLDGWVFLNGAHHFSVEDGVIVGRTTEGSVNSFLCTKEEFGDFEFEAEVFVDPVTNQGIQFRSRVRATADPTQPKNWNFAAGRVMGPQLEIRRFMGRGQPVTGMLYAEATGAGWLSPTDLMKEGHRFYQDDGWNLVRLVARGPHLQTWVNGHPVADIVDEANYRAFPRGFIGLQIHGLNGTEPGFKEYGMSVSRPAVMKWRKLRIRPLPPAP